MKAILEFDLDNPEDEARHLRAVVADDLVMFMEEFRQYLRGLYKYHEGPIDIADIINTWHEGMSGKVEAAVNSWH